GAGDRAALRPLEVDLGGLVVLEDGDALLARVDGDDQLTLRLGQRRALRRLAPALAGCPRLPLLGGSGLALLPRRDGGRGGLAGGRGLALPVAPSAGAAAAFLRGAGFVGGCCRRRRGGLRVDRFRGGCCGSGSRLRRRRSFRLPAPEPVQWQRVSPES